ncbi:unnamed protein product [Pleuronectes platessa]|uniref:Uncharacterized protein n=1 Tax=Pleuronectes platessa TaxID=8262 RepID=A0A9N7UH38_PLEPL|nr:unnamed protein product [Pleuronectes platessa]
MLQQATRLERTRRPGTREVTRPLTGVSSVISSNVSRQLAQRGPAPSRPRGPAGDTPLEEGERHLLHDNHFNTAQGPPHPPGLPWRRWLQLELVDRLATPMKEWKKVQRERAGD